MDNKTINLSDIKRIFNLELDIFEEQDDENNRRVIAPKERAIQRILNRICSDDNEQRNILIAISNEMFNMNDTTYKPICDNLRELGYKILLK